MFLIQFILTLRRASSSAFPFCDLLNTIADSTNFLTEVYLFHQLNTEIVQMAKSLKTNVCIVT